MKIISVVGARPNFIKIAGLVRAINATRSIEHILVHTGQHYDRQMSSVFFEELSIPAPDIDLGVGSGSHAEQTGQIMIAFEKVCEAHRPELIVVVGDVNSTMACALVAAKLCIPIAHVEAGLRSFDRTMPEEINRLVTDSVSRYLFTPSRDADENLIAEGVDPSQIHFVGNVMIDTLLTFRERSGQLDVAGTFGTSRENYAVLTLHRPSNVDDRPTLSGILSAVGEIAASLPVIFPIHPRTRQRISEFGLESMIVEGVHLSDPLSYLEFLNLTSNARFVMTDSGGLQEETTILGIPCLTLRPNTERPVTISDGTSELVGSDPERILEGARRVLHGQWKKSRVPEYWDGKTAGRIVGVLSAHGVPDRVSKVEAHSAALPIG